MEFAAWHPSVETGYSYTNALLINPPIPVQPEYAVKKQSPKQNIDINIRDLLRYASSSVTVIGTILEELYFQIDKISNTDPKIVTLELTNLRRQLNSEHSHHKVCRKTQLPEQ